MRGEKTGEGLQMRILLGSPPHARGKAGEEGITMGTYGITPACAGKSRGAVAGRGRGRDHPRMRGEKKTAMMIRGGLTGSPPHARGKALSDAAKLGVNGITPACAGKRGKSIVYVLTLRDHPRMRGEKRQSIYS